MTTSRETDYGAWGWQLVRLALVVCAIGSALWTFGELEAREFLLENDLEVKRRHQAVGAVGATFVAALSAWILQWRRGPRAPDALLGALRRVNGWLTPWLALPVVLLLSVPEIESKHEHLTLALVVVAALPLGFAVYRLAGPTGLRRFMGRTERWLPVVLVAVAMLGYAAYVSRLALIDHWNLHTQVYDLGIYDNTVWNTAHGKFLGCSYVRTGRHTSAHVDPLLALLVPFYWLYPRAETLLVFQTVWLALGALPLYRIAVRRLDNRWYGVGMAATYLMYPALHGVNMFDFHSLTMSVPLTLAVMDALDEGRMRRYWVLFGLLILAREDMTLLSCGIGLYLIVTRRVRAGLVTIGIAAVYLAVVKIFVMPESALLMKGGRESYSYTYFYEDMIPHSSEGARGLLVSLLTNPAFALKVLLLEDKVHFFACLLLPLLFLPLASGRRVATLLYGLTFIGLASRRHVFSLYFQYSSVLFPFLLAATAHGIARVAEHDAVRAFRLDPSRVRPTLAGMVLLVTGLVSWKYGVLVENDAFRAGWTKLTRDPSSHVRERYRRVRAMVDQIPPDASVSSSTSIGPHVSSRAEAHRWPVVKDADYLLLRTNELSGKKRARERRKYDRYLKSGKYEVIDAFGAIKLLRRVETAP